MSKPGFTLGWVVVTAAGGGALVIADVPHQDSPRGLEWIGGVLSVTDWFLPNRDQLCALTSRADVGDGIGSLGQVLGFLGQSAPAAAARIGGCLASCVA